MTTQRDQSEMGWEDSRGRDPEQGPIRDGDDSVEDLARGGGAAAGSQARASATVERTWWGSLLARGDLASLPAAQAASGPGVAAGPAPSQRRPATPRVPKPVRHQAHWMKRYIAVLVLLDLSLAAVAAVAALFVRFGDRVGINPVYTGLTLLFPVAWVAVAAATRAYEPRFLGAGGDEYRRLFDAALRLTALVAFISYAFDIDIARGYVVIAFPLATVLTLLGRYTARQVLHHLRRRQGRFQHRVVVVGRERAVAELVRQVKRESHAGFAVVGACIDTSRSQEVEGVPVVGNSRSIVEALHSTDADTVAIAAWSALSQDDLRQLSWQLEGSGVSILVAPRLTDVSGPRISIRPVAGLPLLHIEEPEFGGTRRILKGAMDRLVGAAALLCLAPVMLLLGLLVRTNSSGPALYTQTRVGRHGRDFTIYKYRSMRVAADAEVGALAAQNERAEGLLFKIREDPRVTSVGKYLRRFSLDELPQLINVVKGEMSLVGPRPPLPSEVERYGDDVRRRLLVKPGLTGLWQISGRSDLSWEESVRLDLHYVENWSLALDIVIMAKTVVAVLARRGAY